MWSSFIVILCWDMISTAYSLEVKLIIRMFPPFISYLFPTAQFEATQHKLHWKASCKFDVFLDGS